MRLPERDALTVQGLADEYLPSPVKEEALVLHRPRAVSCGIVPVGDERAKPIVLSGAGVVVVAGRVHGERLVRTVVVVEGEEGVYGVLRLLEAVVAEVVVRESEAFLRLGPVEAFHLPLRLRMVHPPVDHEDAKLHHRHLEPGEPARRRRAPRVAVVAQYGDGQPVLLERVEEHRQREIQRLSRQGHRAYAEPAVVVEDVQHVALDVSADAEPALEVGLPHVIRRILDEPDVGRRGEAGLRRYESVALEDAVHCAHAGHGDVASLLQQEVDLPGAYAREPPSVLDDESLRLLGEAVVDVERLMAAVVEFRSHVLPSFQPFVARGSADAVFAAQGRLRLFVVEHPLNELSSCLSHCFPFPRHDASFVECDEHILQEKRGDAATPSRFNLSAN